MYRKKESAPVPCQTWDESILNLCFVVPPNFSPKALSAPLSGQSTPAISAKAALYARSADVLPGAVVRDFQLPPPLCGPNCRLYCFRFLAL